MDFGLKAWRHSKCNIDYPFNGPRLGEEHEELFRTCCRVSFDKWSPETLNYVQC